MSEDETRAALLAYNRGEWCGECRFGIVEDPPCCTIGPRQ